MSSRRLLLAGLLALVPGLRAQDSAARAQALRAAVLVNIALYVRWPESAFSGPDSPLCLGVLDGDAFGPVLEATAAERVIHGRSVVVSRFSEASAARRCHLLYVSEPRDLDGLPGRGLLTVGEGDAFLAAGGVIALAAEGNRLRFDVDLAAAEAAGLTLSSRMLRLARRVRRRAR